MSLESAIADLVSASTSLVSAVNVTKTTIGETEAAAAAQVQPAAASATEAQTQASAAATSASTVSSKLTTAAADYAAQKVTKGLAAVQTAADTELKDRLHRRDPARYPFRGAVPSLVMDFVRQECHRNNAAGNLEPVDLNSFMTFTRESTATYVGPDGLIKTAGVNEARYGYDPVTGEALGLLVEEQRTNLLTYSAASSAASAQNWSTYGGTLRGNAALSPSGFLDACLLTENSATNDRHGVYKYGPSVPAGTYTYTVYVKPAGRKHLILVAYGGSMTTVTLGSVDVTTFPAVGGGFYRVSWAFNVNNPSDVTVENWMSVSVGGGNYYNGDGTSGMYFWGAQLEAGAFPTSYIPTPATFTGRASTKTYFDSNGVLQTAASGVAVTDYGYVDGRWVSKGLSLEPQATNLLTYSVDMSLWAGTRVSTSVSTMLAPDGISYATKITEYSNVDPTTHYISQIPSGVAYSTKYTASVFLKAAERTKACINMHLGDNNASGHFDLVSGVLITTSSSASARITSCGNGWYRCEVTATTGLSGSPNMAVFTLDAAGAQTFIGDGTSGIYVWGAQYETGPVATSYIPTTTAQVTRAADTSTSAQVTRATDTVTSSDMSGWYNNDRGVLFTKWRITRSNNTSNYTQKVVSISNPDGSTSYRIEHGFTTQGRMYAFVSLSGSNIYTWSAQLPASGTDCVAALKYDIGRYTVNLQGSAGTVYGAMSRVPIMSKLSVGQLLNGYIKQLTYFPRQLSDADLQALTILED